MEGDKAGQEPEFVLVIKPKPAPQNNELLKRLNCFYSYSEQPAYNKRMADFKLRVFHSLQI
jgi:hypothetical protein